MKKYNMKKVISISVVLGLVLSFFLIKYDIDIIYFLKTIFVLLVIYIIVMTAILMHKDFKRQKDMLSSGRYDELIKYYEEKHQKFNGRRGYKQQHLINVAGCYHRIGQFQESLDLLYTVEDNKLDKNMKAGYYALVSLNLYFLERNLDKAEELIIKSRKLLDMPESILLQALISIELDNKVDTNKLLQEYHEKTNKKKFIFGIYTVLYIDEYTRNVSEKFMLGLYYQKIGDKEKAKRYFSEAAECNYKNYFSDIAREYTINLN
ncbi:MAG: hypothetical protein Q8936_15230 [Bacillota bacterium]|nr:hypothetical protein [Bacillota bacterium]